MQNTSEYVVSNAHPIKARVEHTLRLFRTSHLQLLQIFRQKLSQAILIIFEFSKGLPILQSSLVSINYQWEIITYRKEKVENKYKHQ